MAYDLIIIGGGPAGYHAGILAGKAGLSTLLIEKNKLGGVCLNEGCIPTKTLLYSAKRKDGAGLGEKYGVHAQHVVLDHPAVLTRKNKTIAMLTAGIKAQLKEAGTETIIGEAEIIGKNGLGFAIGVGGRTYAAEQLLITAGSVPVIPPIPGLCDALGAGIAVTSKDILDLREVPERLAIIGGGAVGLEMASYFRSAGSEVTVIEMLDTIGGGSIDSDISKILQGNLEKSGIRFFTGCRVRSVSARDLAYETKSGETGTLAADKILVCTGRRACGDDIALDKIGVKIKNGAVKTNKRMMTNVEGVYAAGDINGCSMLAHTAYREAEVAVSNIVGHTDIMRYNAIPAVIYTTPEVACTGETEDSARIKGLLYAAKTVSMNFSGRYMAENTGGNGVIKIITDAQKNTLIGVHMIGSYVSEIIFGACIMIERKMPVDAIKKSVFPHPTVSEIIREAVFQL